MAAPQAPSTEPLLTSILDTLGEQIISGALEPGYTFTLQDLSTRFGISRTVAREVMRALEQLGLVSSSRRVGIKVLPAEHWSVFNRSVINWRLSCAEQRPAQITSLNELRTAVEPVAASLAATHATPAQAQRLLELAHQLVELSGAGAGNTPEFLDADKEFHTLILHASGNEMFSTLADPIMHVLEGRTRYGIMPDEPSLPAMRIHIDLAQAIADGDASASELASRNLLTGVKEFLAI